MLWDNPKWTDRYLGNVLTVCLYHPPTPAGESIPPYLTCKPEGDCNESVVVGPDRLSLFLQIHSESLFVCHDAALFHWRLHEHLEAVRDSQGITILWSLSRDCRLHDVILLDQRFRLVRQGRYTLPRKLNQVLDFTPEIDNGFLTNPHQAHGLVAALRERYISLCDGARNIAMGLNVAEETIVRFGPLATGLDVQAAIAFQRIQSHGLLVYRDAAEELLSQAKSVYQHASARLRSDSKSRPCFKWDGELVKRDRRGIPESQKENLRGWLFEVGESLRDLHNVRWKLPHDNQGRPSLMPDHWGILLKCDRRLAAWWDLMASAEAIAAFSGDLNQKIYPRYATVPEIQFIGLNLAWLKRFGPIFQPQPSHRFVVVDLRDLELRCYSRICEVKYHPPDVRLAHQFRGGADPIESLSEWLFAKRNLAENSGRGGFGEVKRHDVARHLLIGTLRGLSDTQIRELVRHEVRNTDIGGVDIARYRGKILDEHHDLETFLEDPTIETLSWRLGEVVNQMIRHLITDEIHTTSGQAIRNVLEGRRRGQPVWEALRGLGRTEQDRALIASEDAGPEALRLLWAWPVTFSGRVDCPVMCTQKRAAEYLALADETRKRVAYEIVAAGWKLAAVVDDDFVIEVPDDANEVEKTLRSRVETAVQQQLARVAQNCFAIRDASLI